jgi:hypothetical protein
MAALPESLQFPPALLGWVVADLGLTPTAIRAVWWVILAGCALAALGLFTRTAALAVTLGVFLYVGELQLYGKVQHIHHLLWIAAVFVVAPSADAVSLSAVGRGLRGHLPVAALPRSRAYAWPLRAIWLSLGLIYLFPGLAKAIVLNVRWFDPSTLQNHIWSKWVELDGYRPFIRVDQSEVLLFLGATGTLVFELGFLLLILTRSTRHLAAIAGLAFHNATNILMRIPFWHLQAMYPLLIDWEWISERVFALRKPLTFLYDGGNGFCKRSASCSAAWSLGRSRSSTLETNPLSTAAASPASYVVNSSPTCTCGTVLGLGLGTRLTGASSVANRGRGRFCHFCISRRPASSVIVRMDAWLTARGAARAPSPNGSSVTVLRASYPCLG